MAVCGLEADFVAGALLSRHSPSPLPITVDAPQNHGAEPSDGLAVAAKTPESAGKKGPSKISRSWFSGSVALNNGIAVAHWEIAK